MPQPEGQEAPYGDAQATAVAPEATNAAATQDAPAWGQLRLELGGGWGHAFPRAPCSGDCGEGLRPGTGYELRAFVRWRMIGFGIVRESATFPWNIKAPEYSAPGASITSGATMAAFRIWTFERAAINPLFQVGVGSASYTVNEPGGVCTMNPGAAFQAGVGLDVRLLPFLKYNVAWSVRTSPPEVYCNWTIKHPRGVPVPPEFAVTTQTLTMGATLVLGEGW